MVLVTEMQWWFASHWKWQSSCFWGSNQKAERRRIESGIYSSWSPTYCWYWP